MGMRVDEALQVRFEDVQIHKPSQNKHDNYVLVKVKGGKLSYLKGATEMLGLDGAAQAMPKGAPDTSSPVSTGPAGRSL